MLIAALTDFEGTMLFVSHDREFLAGLSTRVLELEDGGSRSPTAAVIREYVARSGHEAPGVALSAAGDLTPRSAQRV